MLMLKNFLLLPVFLSIVFYISTYTLYRHIPVKHQNIEPGAWQLHEYLPFLKNKRIGVFANHTSTIGSTHLVDTLKKMGIHIATIFSPEHGFRGTEAAGIKVTSEKDAATGIDIISLYGKKNKPSSFDLQNIDVLLFDVQDVGVRFYTYISSLQYFMEAALENKKPLIILDRPNPLGFYIDGPVLDTAYKSFIGMQPIPVVYGMTIAEYAKMLVGEAWISKQAVEAYQQNNSLLHIVRCKNYTHSSHYELPIAPSPNLSSMNSIYWYPTTCFFEGTVLSEGRGTQAPFQIIGHPQLPDTLFSFIPKSVPAAPHPKWENQICYGWNLTALPAPQQIDISLWLKAYQLFPKKDSFFLIPSTKKPNAYFFNKLAGNNVLMKQIQEEKTEMEIRKSWQPALQHFKIIRKKYLLYTDFL
jgi:uncharacterized protein YbbC (DUF1343 family)